MTINDLKAAIKNWLPDEEIVPADLKLCMKSLDVNCNGRIEQSEFIEVMNKFRATGLPIKEPAIRPATASKQVIRQELPEPEESNDYSNYDMNEVVKEIEMLL